MLAWLRVFQPLMTLLVIPAGIYLWHHAHTHKDLAEAKDLGARVYSSSQEPISTDQLQERWRADIETYMKGLPSKEYRDSVQRQLDSLEKKIDQLLSLYLGAPKNNAKRETDGATTPVHT